MITAARRSSLKRLYGITPEQYDELLKKQGHCCAVCRRHQREFKVRLAVDHNHETGVIRGLLCTNCNNRVVGRHKTPDLLLAAGKYLQGPYTSWVVPKKKPKKRKKRVG